MAFMQVQASDADFLDCEFSKTSLCFHGKHHRDFSADRVALIGLANLGAQHRHGEGY
jgi:hypothetical protein